MKKKCRPGDINCWMDQDNHSTLLKMIDEKKHGYKKPGKPETKSKPKPGPAMAWVDSGVFPIIKGKDPPLTDEERFGGNIVFHDPGMTQEEYDAKVKAKPAPQQQDEGTGWTKRVPNIKRDDYDTLEEYEADMIKTVKNLWQYAETPAEVQRVAQVYQNIEATTSGTASGLQQTDSTMDIFSKFLGVPSTGGPMGDMLRAMAMVALPLSELSAKQSVTSGYNKRMAEVTREDIDYLPSSQYVGANIAHAVYDEPGERGVNDKLSAEGYEYMEDAVNSSEVGVWRNEETNHYFIGFKGTNPSAGKDLVADAWIAAGKELSSSRFQNSISSVEGFMDRIKESDPDAKFSVAGHSLGGRIVNAFVSDSKNMDNLEGAYAFSPGSNPLIASESNKKIKSNVNQGKDYSRLYNNLTGALDILSSNKLTNEPGTIYQHDTNVHGDWDDWLDKDYWAKFEKEQVGKKAGPAEVEETPFHKKLVEEGKASNKEDWTQKTNQGGGTYWTSPGKKNKSDAEYNAMFPAEEAPKEGPTMGEAVKEGLGKVAGAVGEAAKEGAKTVVKETISGVAQAAKGVVETAVGVPPGTIDTTTEVVKKGLTLYSKLTDPDVQFIDSYDNKWHRGRVVDTKEEHGKLFHQVQDTNGDLEWLSEDEMTNMLRHLKQGFHKLTNLQTDDFVRPKLHDGTRLSESGKYVLDSSGETIHSNIKWDNEKEEYTVGGFSLGDISVFKEGVKDEDQDGDGDTDVEGTIDDDLGWGTTGMTPEEIEAYEMSRMDANAYGGSGGGRVHGKKGADDENAPQETHNDDGAILHLDYDPATISGAHGVNDDGTMSFSTQGAVHDFGEHRGGASDG